MSFDLVVAGSRDFMHYDLLEKTLDKLLVNRVDEGVRIISGTARGADELGQMYADKKGYDVILKPAKWNLHGRSAGYKRNVEMADIADAVICFWDGRSRGTKHMIDISESKDIPLRVIRF
tara:strand:+ start:52 stop:411 length:360 start_codon:yes stop_codon:yes gene_type:complete